MCDACCAIRHTARGKPAEAVSIMRGLIDVFLAIYLQNSRSGVK